MKVLGLIPARGGSKGIPKKNVRPLMGKTLIQLAYECAAASNALDRIVLSTDSHEIAKIAKGMGLEVPFLRPSEFAKDESPMIDVALHALDALEKMNYVPDILVLLQPTSPLRRPEHIVRALGLLGENDSVCSVTEMPRDHSPYYVMKITKEGYLEHFLSDGARYTRRQEVPLSYRRDGTIFLVRSSVLREQKSFYGTRCAPMLMGSDESLDIDTEEDWARAEHLLTQSQGELSFEKKSCLRKVV